MLIYKSKIGSYPVKNGMRSLYIRYYPHLYDKSTGRLISQEVLRIYIYDTPKDEIQKIHNAKVMNAVRAIHAQRVQALVNGDFSFLDKGREKADFLEYFAEKAKVKGCKWDATYKHFRDFVKGKCLFKDLEVHLCRKFRDYLLTTARHNIKWREKLSNNTASAYYKTFRAALKLAYQEKYLKENLNNYLQAIKNRETKREYLTMEEVKRLAITPCRYEVLKQASLFACMTGLRISDILQLSWEHITKTPLGGWCIRLTTQKTKTDALLPISNDTLELCGERSEGLIFKGLTRVMTQHSLKRWIKEAGIEKSISFHCFRHTFATLQLAADTDIYTVSKLLTHRHVSTTETYANIVNEKKIASSRRITLKDK